MELIDRQKAIETIQKMKEEREKRTCQRVNIIQAQALGYVIEVLKKLPAYEEKQ